MASIECHGLWVPKSEASRWEQCGEFEGLPNLDVKKAADCAALCSSFETALDIGAHVGAVSIYLSRKFKKVFAFEAVPSTYGFLRRNAEAIPNIEALNLAIGSEGGEVYFAHYDTHGQLSHVASKVEEPKTTRVGPIAVRPIDSMDLGMVSFMKIDVEGYELPVIEGARTTIERDRPLILVEQGGNDEKHFGRPRDEASAFLESLGMTRHPKAPFMSKDRLYTF
jgi:FkbM family methyltransferase